MMDRDQLAILLGQPNLPVYLKKVDQELKNLSSSGPASLKRSLGQITGRGGKRLRPALLITAAASSGKSINSQIITAAVAVELVHLASLVHDDILDNTRIRRDQPSINKLEGAQSAILVGDFLLAKACAQAAAVSQAAGVTLADTIATMAEGVALELDSDGVKPLSRKYLEISQKKTAALFSTAGRLGGISAGLSSRDIEALSRYGDDFGMAFQIIDDLVDQDIPKVLTAQALDKAQFYNAKAVAALKGLKASPATVGLAKLPGFYLDWAIKSQNAIV
jgi:geranylgeranyl pyrophosphate synthase